MLYQDAASIDAMTKQAGAGDILMALQSLRASAPVAGAVGKAVKGKAGDAAASAGARMLNKGVNSKWGVIRGPSEHVAESVANVARKTEAGQPANFTAELVAGGLSKGLQSNNPILRGGSSLAAGTLEGERLALGHGAQMMQARYGQMTGVPSELGWIATAVESGGVPAVNMAKKAPGGMRNLMNSVAMTSHMAGLQPAAAVAQRIKPAAITRAAPPRPDRVASLAGKG